MAVLIPKEDMLLEEKLIYATFIIAMKIFMK